MKLVAFRITNFRSIVDTGWCPFASDGITVIVGQNESGKSSILEALATTFHETDISDDDCRIDAPMPAIFLRIKIDAKRLLAALAAYNEDQVAVTEVILEMREGELIVSFRWRYDAANGKYVCVISCEDNDLAEALQKKCSADKGQDAINFRQPGFMPFCVGDVNPGGMFVHVFDDVAIKRVLEHLNTITDFTRYLNKRAAYLLSGRLALAHGEEELLANYLNTGIMTGGEYDFEPPRKKKAEKAAVMTVQGEWSAYVLSERYFAKTLADDISYAWDKLITLFTENLLEGTSVSVLGAQATIGTAEEGLRFMAMESRFSRRVLGEAVGGALSAARELNQDRYARVIFPSQASANPQLAYVIMILAYPTDLEAKGGMKRGYEQYREVRAKMLEAYSLGALHTYRNLNTVVCIGLDAHSSQTGRKGGSEDFFAMRIDEWTPQLEAYAVKAIEHYDILREERLIKQRVSRDEYPVLGEKAAGARWPKNRPSKSRHKKPKR